MPAVSPDPIEVPDNELRRYDQDVLAAGGRLEQRIRERVPLCWFCPATAGQRAREHVFPQWLLRHLNAEDETVAPYRLSLRSGVDTVTSRREMPLRSVVAGEVCHTCNSGWMSQLETHAKPLLAAARRRGALDPADARTLARWFTKTAVALNVSMPFRLLFDARTRHTLAYGVPPNVTVAFSIARRGNGKIDWAQTTAAHAVVPDSADMDRVRDLIALAYTAHIQIDRLVGTVVVLPDELAGTRIDSAARQIWPLSGKAPTWGALPRVRDMYSVSAGLDLSTATRLPDPTCTSTTTVVGPQSVLRGRLPHQR